MCLPECKHPNSLSGTCTSLRYHPRPALIRRGSPPFHSCSSTSYHIASGSISSLGAPPTPTLISSSRLPSSLEGPRLLRTGFHHRFLWPCPPPHDPVRLHYTGLTTLPAYHTSQAPRGGLKREAQPRFRDRRGALYNHGNNIMATRTRRNCARAS
jgi:hypothetical protein